MAEFRKWQPITRLYRDVVVTEKIDGTNGCVIVEQFQFGTHVDGTPAGSAFVLGDPLPEDHPAYDGLPDTEYLVTAQSRNRIVTPGKDDNHGFAGWVHAHAGELARLLGPGYHYGEWWGNGIQHGYGLDEKRFSLFNTGRWQRLAVQEAAWEAGLKSSLDVVPVLYNGVFDSQEFENLMHYLDTYGSVAAPDCGKAEGIVIYHKPSGNLFKYTLDGDGHKGG